MSVASAFIDSNIWLYAFIQSQDPNKTIQATGLITSIPTIYVSKQVINEVCVNLLRKQNASEAEIRDFIDDFFTLKIIPIYEITASQRNKYETVHIFFHIACGSF